MSFEKLNLIEPILRALKSEGYTTPTPIQAQSIPVLLERKDLLGCAQTGTGKTAAFAIPILQLLHQDELYVKGPQGIKCLILTPTRELAIQIGESFAAYGKHLRIKHTVIFGGVSQKSQTDALRSGVDILIATPGRLLDLMDQRYVHLQHIKMFVLDEADRMLDMGFIHDVKKIIAKLPSQRQTLFFSATMPSEISKLASTILTNPVRVEVTPPATTANTIQQVLYYVEKSDKRSLLMHLLKDRKIETALVFTRTKHGADKVVKDLNKEGIRAEAIHGNKSQNARQRALSSFKAKQLRVLVATDIAARGIDIDELSHVINYELPNIPETYVHRIGRTGRAGASGIAFSFCESEEKDYLRDIHKLIGKTIPVVQDHPYHSTRTDHVPPPKMGGGGGQRQRSSRNSGPSRSSGPEHISTYALTIEEKTVFGNWRKKGKLKVVDEEIEARQFELLMDLLSDAGYTQYEISNFSKPGFVSRHNSSYWKQSHYLGIGPSAHSYNGVSRQSNVRNNALYVRAIQDGTLSHELEILSPENKINEYILTGLRTIWGCDFRFLKNTLGDDLMVRRKEYIDQITHQGLVLVEDETLKLTRKGKLLADKIAEDLII